VLAKVSVPPSAGSTAVSWKQRLALAGRASALATVEVQRQYHERTGDSRVVPRVGTQS